LQRDGNLLFRYQYLLLTQTVHEINITARHNEYKGQLCLGFVAKLQQ